MFLLLSCGKAYYSEKDPPSDYIWAIQDCCSVCPYLVKKPVNIDGATVIVSCCKIKKVLK